MLVWFLLELEVVIQQHITVTLLSQQPHYIADMAEKSQWRILFSAEKHCGHDKKEEGARNLAWIKRIAAI